MDGLEVFNSLGETEWLTGRRLQGYWQRWEQIVSELRNSSSTGQHESDRSGEEAATELVPDDMAMSVAPTASTEDDDADSDWVANSALGLAGVGGAWLLARRFLKRAARPPIVTPESGQRRPDTTPDPIVITQDVIDELRANSNELPQPELLAD